MQGVIFLHHHIRRHFQGSGVLGATITRWSSWYAMRCDPWFERTTGEIISSLDPNSLKTQVIHVQAPFYVGYEGIVPIREIPPYYDVWREDREGHEVQVTNLPPRRTKSLKFIIRRCQTGYGSWAWKVISIFAGSGESRPLTDRKWWMSRAFFDMR